MCKISELRDFTDGCSYWGIAIDGVRCSKNFLTAFIGKIHLINYDNDNEKVQLGIVGEIYTYKRRLSHKLFLNDIFHFLPCMFVSPFTSNQICRYV